MPQVKLDVDALGAYVVSNVPLPASKTHYSGIRAEIHPDAWGPLVEGRPRVRTAREAIRRLRGAIVRAIEQSVENAHRVAVFAGGGIDSAVLLALTIEVMRRRGGSAFAIAMDFEGPGDDRPHLRALEARLGCEVVRVSPAAGAAHIAVFREGIDAAPAAWPFVPLLRVLYDAARENGAERILSGVGGDHFFDGDPRAFAPMIKRDPLQAIAAARSLEGFDEPRFPVLERILRPLVAARLPLQLRKILARRRRASPASTSWAGPRLLEITRALSERALDHTLSNAGLASVTSYFEHPDQRYIAWIAHQEQHASGIGRYDPYFTYEVGEEVAAIPAEMLLLGGRRRGLLREVMRGSLPDSLLDRPNKAEFTPAFQMLFRAAGGVGAFAEELEGRMLGRLGLVQPRAFKREVTRQLEALDWNYGQCWPAVAAEAFLLRRPELV